MSLEPFPAVCNCSPFTVAASQDVRQLVDANLRELGGLEKKLDQQIAGSAQAEPGVGVRKYP